MNEARPENIPALTGVRAVASWWVVLYHLRPVLWTLFPGTKMAVGLIANGGEMGVDLFFLLSGFVLSHNYYRGFGEISLRKYCNFVYLRAIRIYPAYIAGLAMWCALFGISVVLGRQLDNPAMFSGRKLVESILLVQAWTWPVAMVWNYPAWSVSLEWFMYLWFPFLVRFWLTRVGAKAALWVAVILICCGTVAIAELPLFRYQLRILVEFPAGCLLWKWFSGYRAEDRFRDWGGVSTICAALIAANAIGWYSVPFMALVVVSAATSRGMVARWLGGSIPVYWGQVSYSLYIVHAAAITGCHAVLPLSNYETRGLLVRCAVLAGYVGAIAIGGVLCFHAIEEPSRKWLRSRWVIRETRVESAGIVEAVQ